MLGNQQHKQDFQDIVNRFEQASQRGLDTPGLPQLSQPQHEDPHQLAVALGTILPQQPNLLPDLQGGEGSFGSSAAKAWLAPFDATAARQLLDGTPTPGISH